MQLQAITHIPLSKDAYMVNENTIVIRLKVGKGDIKSSDKFIMEIGFVCQNRSWLRE